MARQIVRKISPELLQQDLERYRQRALELGATDAAIIRASDVVVDERVRSKCLWPKCEFSGKTPHCPPHTPDSDSVQKLVNKYDYAILFRYRFPSQIMEAWAKTQEGWDKGEGEIKKEDGTDMGKTFFNDTATRIEFEAFHDGHHLALAFACGTCKAYLCPGMECQALIPGQACRNPLRARPSMEAMGLDVYKMATDQGWDIYPIGMSTTSDDVPCVNIVSMVLIC